MVIEIKHTSFKDVVKLPVGVSQLLSNETDETNIFRVEAFSSAEGLFLEHETADVTLDVTLRVTLDVTVNNPLSNSVSLKMLNSGLNRTIFPRVKNTKYTK